MKINEETIDKLYKKMQKDFRYFKEDKYMCQSKEFIFNSAYTIAYAQVFYDELEYEFDNFDEEFIEDFSLSEIAVDKLFEMHNMFDTLVDKWREFHHPERYNVMYDHGDAMEVIEYIARGAGGAA